MPIVEGRWPGQVLWTALFFFVLALVLRVLFLQSFPDSTDPFSPYYVGDTPTWLEYAEAIRADRAFDLDLPMRPPGIAYLVAAMWNGQQTGLLFFRLAWSVLGAAVVGLMFLTVWRSFGLRVAQITAFICAASTGLIVLSTSINNETPYLFLVIVSFLLWEPVRQRPRTAVVVAWSALNGIACLIRAEHVLFFVLTTAFLAWTWAGVRGEQAEWRNSLGLVLVMLVCFVLPLVPWHLNIWTKIAQFNQSPAPTSQSTLQAYSQLEQTLSVMRWDDEALQEKQALPAFLRRPISNFVAATVAVRGGMEVRGHDFMIIDEAFGSRPEPIAARPFVTLYGGLNFYLANNPLAAGGFSTAPLETRPPLAGGLSRYPGFLVMGLPPPDLALSYPPHLELVNHGYHLGLEWMLDHPADYLALAWRKVRIFWSGVALGFTGYNFPLGNDGIRRPVDLVVPQDTIVVVLWRWAALACLALGIWLAWREAALVPWLLLLVTKTVATLGFFGYAREGAVVIPVFALLAGLLLVRGLPKLLPFKANTRPNTQMRTWFFLGVTALTLVCIEAYRWSSEPQILIDGKPIESAGMLREFEYREQTFSIR